MKTKATFKLAKRLGALLVSMMIMATMLVTSAFAANEAVRKDEDGVFPIQYGYTEGNTFIPVSIGSGFLINDETVITCFHVVHLDDSDIDDSDIIGILKEELGNNWESKMSIKVIFQEGNAFDATEIAEIANPSGDFTALKLKSPMVNVGFLSLSDKAVENTDKVYALGFPYEKRLVEDLSSSSYTGKDVSTDEGSVSKASVSVGGAKRINHSVPLLEGHSGGPLVNEDGEVVGINVSKLNDNTSYAVPIDLLKKALDIKGIQYNVGSGSSTSSSDGATDFSSLESTLDSAKAVADPSSDLTAAIKEAENVVANEEATQNEVDAAEDALLSAMNPTADKTSLSTELESAKAIDLSKYDEASVTALNAAIEKATAVNDNPAATQSDVDNAVKELKSTRDSMKEKKNILPFAIGGVAVVIVIIIIVIVIVTKNGKKKTEAFIPVSEPVSGAVPTGGSSGFTNAQQTPVPDFNPQLNVNDDGAGLTGVLNSGAGETSVLSSGASETTVLTSKPYATLTRKSNNETIQVAAAEFVIGKERRKVTYCISDNTSISRTHAKIVNSAGTISLVDMNSKNGTFVNGIKCTPNASVVLKNGDIIVLSDEEFTFRML
ncbi:trypsin-like peptidase domain-containing protein [Butyricicoccus sp.]|uniref:trypsin-like peptidase domain-containing protein n=1 Tax=Butyricicoccus sp. TaxID=2049021 RepID=UPI003F1762C2